MTPLEIAKIRSASQRIATRDMTTPAEVVQWFGAMQAQDYPAAKWAIGLRLATAQEQLIEDAIEKKHIIRTWPMRGTLHFVPLKDAHWMLDVMAQRVLRKFAGRYRQLGLVEDDFTKAREVLSQAMQDGQRFTRKEIMQTLETHGLDTTGQRGYHMVVHLAHQGYIGVAGLTGKQPTFVWMDDWIPKSERNILHEDEARIEMARRYIRSHGPVTVYDFAWWTGLTIKECREAFTVLEPDLAKVVVADQKEPYWMFATCDNFQSIPDSVRLVPPFDEVIVALKDRSAIVSSDDFARLVPYSNGMFSPAIIINGQFAGLWSRVITKQGVTVEVRLAHKISGAQASLLQQEAERYAGFLGQSLQNFTITEL